MPYISSRRDQPLDVPESRCSDDVLLHQFGTQQIVQVLRASKGTTAYDSENAHIQDVVAFLFWDRMASVTLRNEVRFFQRILESNRKISETAFVDMTTQTTFVVVVCFTTCGFSTTAHKRSR